MVAFLCVIVALSGGQPVALRCEHRVDPIGLDVAVPRFSWRLDAGERDPGSGVSQSSYRILVATDPAVLALDGADVWDSGRIATDATTEIDYAGSPLAPHEALVWKVMAWDQDERASPWSPLAHFSTGPIVRGGGDGREGTKSAATIGSWPGEWIGFDSGESAALLRTGFDVERPLARATAYVTALGVADLHLNGARVGDDCFTPGWTDYRKRVHWRAFDVTGRMRPGRNVVGLELAAGWFAGHISASRNIRNAGAGPVSSA